MKKPTKRHKASQPAKAERYEPLATKFNEKYEAIAQKSRRR